MQVTVVRCISCNTLYIVLCSWHNAHICTLWNGFINLDLHVMQIAHVMLYNAHCCTLNDLWCTLHKVHCGVLSESFSLNVICISLGTYCWLHFSGHILQQICRGGEVDSNVQLSTLMYFVSSAKTALLRSKQPSVIETWAGFTLHWLLGMWRVGGARGSWGHF